MGRRKRAYSRLVENAHKARKTLSERHEQHQQHFTMQDEGEIELWETIIIDSGDEGEVLNWSRQVKDSG